MDRSLEFLTTELHARGIRPSYQRVKVLEYLHHQQSHPTVDEIFQALASHIPSLSKTTIYNALHTFLEAGLVRVVNIDEGELRYDITLFNHGHFMCDRCGAITNFAIEIDRIPIDELSQFEITEKNVYFKGLCPNCLDQLKVVSP